MYQYIFYEINFYLKLKLGRVHTLPLNKLNFFFLLLAVRDYRWFNERQLSVKTLEMDDDLSLKPVKL